MFYLLDFGGIITHKLIELTSMKSKLIFNTDGRQSIIIENNLYKFAVG